MEALTDPHWTAVPPFLSELLSYIGQNQVAEQFYLAGGTALALQLGHRLSVDLDFFSQTDELLPPTRRTISDALQKKYAIDVADAGLGSLLLGIQGSFLGFYSYTYPLLSPPKMLEGNRVASLTDIGLMKMDSLAGRGTRKDFIDLYFIAQAMPLEALLERSREKFPYVRNFPLMTLQAMVDFEIAEKQAPIETNPAVSWSEIKSFFEAEARRIGKQWFES
jgi:hypothetical protein